MRRDEIDREMRDLMGKLVNNTITADEKNRLQNLTWLLTKSLSRDLRPLRRVLSRQRKKHCALCGRR